jgi:hypothetical protein
MTVRRGELKNARAPSGEARQDNPPFCKSIFAQNSARKYNDVFLPVGDVRSATLCRSFPTDSMARV